MGDQSNYMSYANTLHPYPIQDYRCGLDELAKLVDADERYAWIPDTIGNPDHYGTLIANNGTGLGKAVEKYRLAWLEDIVSME